MNKSHRAAALLLCFSLLLSSPALADFSGIGSGNESVSALFEHAGELLEDGTEKLSDELREALDGLDLSTLGNDLKRITAESRSLSDDELRREVQEIAGNHGLQLTDDQLDKAVSFCRRLEKLEPEALEEKVEELRDQAETARSALNALQKVQGFFRRLWDGVRSVGTGIADAVRRLFSHIGK